MNFIDGIYYVLYFLVFNYFFMTTTMFYPEKLWRFRFPLERAMNIVTFFLIGIAVLTILFIFENWPRRILPSVLLVAAAAHAIIRGGTYNNDILVFILLVICSKRKSFKLIAYCSLFCGTLWLLVSFICTRFGFLTDIVYDGSSHALGSVYRTDLMCHFLTLTMLLFIIRKGKPSIFSLVISAILLIIDGLYIQANIGFFVYAVLLTMTILYKYTSPKLENFKVTSTIYSVVMCSSFAIFAFLTIYLTYTFTRSNPNFITTTKALKTVALRLEYGKRAFEEYKVLPFGQTVYEYADRGRSASTIDPKQYFFLDISYIRILFQNGYVMLGAVIVLFTSLQIRMWKHKQFYVMFVIALFAFTSIFEHSMIEPAYCVFSYLLFADLDFDRPLISSYIED